MQAKSMGILMPLSQSWDWEQAVARQKSQTSWELEDTAVTQHTAYSQVSKNWDKGVKEKIPSHQSHLWNIHTDTLIHMLLPLIESKMVTHIALCTFLYFTNSQISSVLDRQWTKVKSHSSAYVTSH